MTIETRGAGDGIGLPSRIAATKARDFGLVELVAEDLPRRAGILRGGRRPYRPCDGVAIGGDVVRSGERAMRDAALRGTGIDVVDDGVRVLQRTGVAGHVPWTIEQGMGDAACRPAHRPVFEERRGIALQRDAVLRAVPG